MTGKKYVPKVDPYPGYYTISLKELYRVTPAKKNRKGRRLRRRHARWIANMTPEERAMYDFIQELNRELLEELNQEIMRQVLWGDGTGGLVGIVNA